MESSGTITQETLARSFRTAMGDAGKGSSSGVLFQESEVEGCQGIRFEASADTAAAWDVAISVPQPVRLVAHGHSASFWINEVQAAELLLESSAPSRLAVANGGTPEQELVLAGEAGTCKVELRLGEFLLKDRGIARPGMNWFRHDSKRSLNYLLDTVSGQPAGKLLVVFSAIGAEYDFTYNYRASLEQSSLSKAFVIDDFGRQGSYYWMDHGEESIFHETQQLLTRLMDDLGVELRDVMFAGSSKGGTAALLHGVSLGVGKILVGAPQYKVGDYLFGAAPQILDFMTGGASTEHRDFLNARAKEILLSGQRRSAIRVAVGSADHHLASHVKPLMEDAGAAGYDIDTLVLPGLPHSEIGQIFRHLLSAEVSEFEQGSSQDPLPYSLSRKAGNVSLRCWPGQGETLAVYLFGKSGILEQRAHTAESDFLFQLPEDEGMVRARVFRRSVTGPDVRAFTTRWI